MSLTLIATTTMGLESVLNNELKRLGYTNTVVEDGKVSFQGELSDICRTNLWLRTAGRVYVQCAQFKALTFDQLYELTRALPWHDWIQPEDAFPITKVTAKNSELFSKSDCQSIVKKAIVDQLKAHYNTSQLPESSEAVFAVRIQIDKDRVTLSIDTTGHGLNKRGYRAHMDTAPLRETLAAGLVLLSRWRPDLDVLLDPFCGTGTILIEAAMIAENRAPGLNRRFASQHWKALPEQLWAEAFSAAKDAIDSNPSYCVQGSDMDSQVLEIAKENADLAGIRALPLSQSRVQDLSSTYDTGKIISNPPYGERLEEEDEIARLYQEMRQRFKSDFNDWDYYILTAHENFAHLFKDKPKKHRKLYNGGMKCYFYQYF